MRALKPSRHPLEHPASSTGSTPRSTTMPPIARPRGALGGCDDRLDGMRFTQATEKLVAAGIDVHRRLRTLPADIDTVIPVKKTAWW